MYEHGARHYYHDIMTWLPYTEYCVTNDHIYVLFVVITIQSVWYLLFFISFPVMLCQITGFVTRLTRWMSLVEQELLTRPEYLSLPRGFRVAQSSFLSGVFLAEGNV